MRSSCCEPGPFPVEGHPEALLLQETSLEPSVSDSLRLLPLGLAWIDLRSDRALLINDGFWKAWPLPGDRRPDLATKLRAECRGYVLDSDDFDRAWPKASVGTGTLAQIALTDGRRLEIATLDRPPHHRWLFARVAESVGPDGPDELNAPQLGAESQRLESLAVLAGGIAHDLNNLLLVVIANAELLRDEGDESIQTAVADIRVAAERASDLSGKMLAYSGHGHMVAVPTEILSVVESVIAETVPDSSHGARLALSDNAERAAVNGDKEQLNQLLKAVLLNALESDGAQRVTVDCEVTVWTPQALSRLYLGEQLVSGPYVSVLVRDDGEGIDESVLPRVFDPFFSTRGMSRGLGLAAAAGIARSHGGTISIRSTRGQGAEARILLPLLQPRERTPSNVTAPRSAAHEGTILLVDDESLVRRSARQALEQAGFQVVEAENGEQALTLFSRQPERFNLVIMDISMPGAPGDLVAKEMRSLTETPVPLILSSGYRPPRGSRGCGHRRLLLTEALPTTRARAIGSKAPRSLAGGHRLASSTEEINPSHAPSSAIATGDYGRTRGFGPEGMGGPDAQPRSRSLGLVPPLHSSGRLRGPPRMSGGLPSRGQPVVEAATSPRRAPRRRPALRATRRGPRPTAERQGS